ncbi:MAG: methyltransferase [Bacteroidales bacterium]|jgi:tRNA1Val (adenine37-N6)-methyltransferase|nr:methyltransferase [Bacteroidales bacterium]
MFHFKQFSVSHSQSSMKVGTDAVLLGAWMPVPENCKTVLEIGSGCGVISLMIAQRTNARIIGIDIDENSVIEAQNNAENSPWKTNVHFIRENLQEFAQNTTRKFEVIVSNPPFFENSLKSPVTKRNIAKHNETLSLKELLDAVDILLLEKGRFGTILPTEPAEKMEKFAFEKNIYLTKKTKVFPNSKKSANRVLMMFERKNVIYKEDNLYIRNEDYTDEYYSLMKEYLIIQNSKFKIQK